MVHGDRAPMEDALGEYWNALVANPPGSPSSSTDLDPSLIATIQRLRLLDDAHAPDPAFVEELERALVGTSDASAWDVPGNPIARRHSALNGHGSTRDAAGSAVTPINHQASVAGRSPGGSAAGLLGVAALLILALALSVVAGLPRQDGEERGAAPAILPAVQSDPVAFVWQSQGTPDLLATRGSSEQLLPMTGPYHLAIDAHGNLWIPDTWSNQFRILAPDGAFRQVWGSKGRGEGEFNFLNVGAFSEGGSGAAAFDAAGNLYVADPGNFRIQKFAPDLSFLTAWGSKGEGDGQFLALNDLAIDSQGRVYALDKLRSDVQVFDASGEFLARWGGKGVDEGEFLSPHGLAVDGEGNVVVADTGNHRIQKFSPDGTFLALWGGMGTDSAMFRLPDDVAIDARGRMFVTDSSNNRVQILDEDGQFLAEWGKRGSEPGQFRGPTGIAIDQAGNVYVTESVNARVQKFRLLPPIGG